MLWASGYEIYNRISEPYQKFLEGLTGTYSGRINLGWDSVFLVSNELALSSYARLEVPR